MRRLAALLLFALALGNLGCRRAPEKPTLFYEREAAEQATVLRAKKRVEQEEYTSDRYAWEDRHRRIDELPDRLADTQIRLKAEIELINQLMHGKNAGK